MTAVVAWQASCRWAEPAAASRTNDNGEKFRGEAVVSQTAIEKIGEKCLLKVAVQVGPTPEVIVIKNESWLQN